MHEFERDLTGVRFGKLVAVERMVERNNDLLTWKCICDCGNTAYVSSSSLIRGMAKSCGCESTPLKPNLRGKRFSHLKVLAPTQRYAEDDTIWKCQCECGKIVYATTDALQMKKILSCGCHKYNRLKGKTHL